MEITVYRTIHCGGGLVKSYATPWTVAHQAPLSMGFPSQEYWSVLPFPLSGDLPNPGVELPSPAWQEKPSTIHCYYLKMLKSKK